MMAIKYLTLLDPLLVAQDVMARLRSWLLQSGVVNHGGNEVELLLLYEVDHAAEYPHGSLAHCDRFAGDVQLESVERWYLVMAWAMTGGTVGEAGGSGRSLAASL